VGANRLANAIHGLAVAVVLALRRLRCAQPRLQAVHLVEQALRFVAPPIELVAYAGHHAQQRVLPRAAVLVHLGEDVALPFGFA